jgi:hypothetical protein
MTEETQPPPKRFGEFAKGHVPLDGTKLKIGDILNTEITVMGYRVKSSKYNQAPCLTIQFSLAGETHVAFTGSQVLLDQLKEYEGQLPFLATVKKIDRYYSFT